MVQEIPAVPAKKLHPFFTPRTPASTATTPSSVELDEPQIPNENAEHANSKESRPRKRRKTDDVADSGNDSERDRKPRKGGRKATAAAEITVAQHFTKSDEAPAGQDTEILGVHLCGEMVDNQMSELELPRPGTTTAPLNADPQTNGPDGSTKSNASPGTNHQPAPNQPKPKKLLKFNPKTGTIGSPPKAPRVVTGTSPQDRQLASRIVTVHYGSDEAKRTRIGTQITSILSGTSKRARQSSPQRLSAARETHPFFSSKITTSKTSTESNPKVPSSVSESPRKKVFLATPCSPRKPTTTNSTGPKMASFGARPAGLKFPGTVHPAWPPKGMDHIRQDEDDLLSPIASISNMARRQRKAKGRVVNVSSSESILNRLSRAIDIGTLAQFMRGFEISADDDPPPPAELRLPKKHLESGKKLQLRIRPQLRTLSTITHQSLPDSSDDEITVVSRRARSQATKSHPAIERLYQLLSAQLPAHDRSDCESSCWAQKYAPLRADEVLQGGKEASMIKQWLEGLKVQSVESGTAEAPKLSVPAKKKRKGNKLDGFVVSSDDEEDEMAEVSDGGEWAPKGAGSGLKTVVRSGDAKARGSKESPRLINTIVISGPHGCGKSAAVYAVANELDFEVFEINSSSRRSGRDIIERVGDMTRNHLVQQHRSDPNLNEEAIQEDDEVTRDLKSGRQSTMASFFKPKESKAKGSSRPSKATEEPKKSAPSKGQKQSLILLEEVDILFQEDKQFWSTVVDLIAQSKRPFILTCNDENLVPLQTLTLHGIFRFTPPPQGLIEDLLLLIAANEGHALKRPAIKTLCESHPGDIRACLMELNYWCQIGVGDRRGGFDWFYPRWPKGCDRDEHGDVVRVISEDTYLQGMGWLARDGLYDPSTPRDIEEQLCFQCWAGWELDLTAQAVSDDLWLLGEIHDDTSLESRRQFSSLVAFDDYCDALSAADICSGGSFRCNYQASLDPSAPALPARLHDDFIIGRQLIEATPATDYSQITTSISVCLISMARHTLRHLSNTTPSALSTVQPVNEDSALQSITSSFQPSQTVTRKDYSLAFDPIAASDKALHAGTLEPSVFDGTMRTISLDIAPFVRSIVAYDHRLMETRIKRSNLLSEGGRLGKRMRNTRSAFSALEGGARSVTRRESWFTAMIKTHVVMGTGGEWGGAVQEQMELDEERLTAGANRTPTGEDHGDKMEISA